MTMQASAVLPAQTMQRLSIWHWMAGLLALGCGAAGLTLGVNYPVAQPWAAGLFALFAGLFFIRPNIWLVVVPALLPVIGLAPWTGWLTFEELDLLVLAVAAAGYARLAAGLPLARSNTQQAEQKGAQHEASVSMLTLLGFTLFLMSVVLAMFRGFADAGGFSFGWFQGYHEPMNSVRLSKSIFEALLVVPLWRVIQRQNPERAQALLSQGLMFGLAAAALATIWERAAFTGLLNFSTDYRTTGLFWEMHVGGAGLDGFLALTVPFVLRELLVAQTPIRWGVAATVLALAGYSCLTTFSRGVYLAIPVGGAIFLTLHAWQRKRFLSPNSVNTGPLGMNSPVVAMLLVIAGFAIGGAWMFQTSGYRGMAALLGTMALMLPVAGVIRSFRFNQWLLGVVMGAVLILLAVAITWLVPKGAYIAWVLAISLTLVTLVLLRRGDLPSAFAGPTVFASFLATIAGTALVADHWGDWMGLMRAIPVLLVLLCVCVAAGVAHKPLWPDALRWQSAATGAMMLVAAVVGIFGGGNFMSDRFLTGKQDAGGRLAHWQLGRDMLRTQADWWWGKGMGRFPSSYFLIGNPKEHPGDYRLKQEANETYLTLAGGLHLNGWGEIFRVTQRIAEPGKRAVVTASVRSEKDITLHFEVCQKHLLYNESCVNKDVAIKAAPGVWQPVKAELEGENITRGDWYVPRLLAFSMAMESRGGMADVDNVALTNADGGQLLANGDFSGGMAHWFFSSDKHHLPWHIKSIFMNVLFDQGIVGLALWSALLAGALWRISFGRARRHTLAPALAASLAGFVVIGFFDSLLDVPRLAWLFYLLLMLALTLRSGSQRPDTRRSAQVLTGLALTLASCCLALQPSPAQASESDAAQAVIRVGPGRAIKTIARSAQLASDGAIIEVDFGDYVGDVAVWTQDRLTLRAVGGRVRLIAGGAAAEGKAIWVMRGGQMSVEGFDFTGARVPGQNGAGIRLERGALRVRDCTFTDNENGILTGNEPQTELEIENSEFGHNGYGDGQSHNLYAGAIARLSVKDSHFHHARVGHLLKSRAKVNHIYNNRLVDGDGGSASYELEFPVGGEARVVGNVIAQSISTANPHLISFGAEGYKWPRNEIHLENNTLVNPLPKGGVFLRVAPVGAGAIRAVNNRLIGEGTLETAGPGEYRNNTHASLRDGVRALDSATHNSGLPQRSTPRLP